MVRELRRRVGVSFHQFALPGYPASHACVRLLDGRCEVDLRLGGVMGARERGPRMEVLRHAGRWSSATTTSTGLAHGRSSVTDPQATAIALDELRRVLDAASARRSMNGGGAVRCPSVRYQLRFRRPDSRTKLRPALTGNWQLKTDRSLAEHDSRARGSSAPARRPAAPFVREEQRRMILRRGLRVAILRRHAEEEEQPRHLLLEEREVLGRAGQRADADVLGAGHALQRRRPCAR